MARIAGIDLPRNKRADIALTYIYGIGSTTAAKILAEADIDRGTNSDHLSESEDAAAARDHRARLQGRG